MLRKDFGMRRRGRFKLWAVAQFILIIGRVNAGGGKNEFKYSGPLGPECWAEKYPTCGGRNQSPINVDTCMVDTDINLPPLRFGPGYKDNIPGKLENNGETVKFTPNEDAKGRLTLWGGPLGEDRFRLEQLHFHWGSEDQRGSEHSINGHRFPLEMHMVHRNLRYPTTLEAADQRDGFVAISVLFEKDPYEGNGQWLEGVKPYSMLCDNLINALPRVSHPGRSVSVPAMNLSTHFHVDFHEYFLYSGSFTTPKCNEVVRWIIPTCFSKVTCEQMAAFRKLVSHDSKTPMADNNRPTQPLNRRKIYKVCNRKNENMIYDYGAAGGKPSGAIQMNLASVVMPSPEHHQYSPPPSPQPPNHDQPHPQHHSQGPPEDMRHYSEDIKQKILSAYESGSSLDEIKRSIGLEPR